MKRDRTITVIVAAAFFCASCIPVINVRSRKIIEEDIGELSFISVDEKHKRLVPGVVVEIHREGDKEPFRTFLSDSRGPILLTDIPPGKYTITATGQIDPLGVTHHFSGKESKTVQISAGKRYELSLFLNRNKNRDTGVATVIIVNVLLIALVVGSDSSGHIHTPLLFVGPGGESSAKLQRMRHRHYSYDAKFFDAVDPEVSGPPGQRVILLEGDEKDPHEAKMLSPDMPLVLITHPESQRSRAKGNNMTIHGKAKNVRGIHEVRIEGRGSRRKNSRQKSVFYSAPVSIDGSDPGKEIEFSCEYSDLQPGENLLRVKVIDTLGFSAERYLVVVRENSPR